MGQAKRDHEEAILIVEDDPQMRTTCLRILSRFGYRSEAVADGQEALARLRADRTFRLVLLDLKLPKIDGVTVLRRIRELDTNIKVIIMTGFATVQSAVQSMKLGAVDYLVKPFEKDELLAVVSQQIRMCELQRRVERLESELQSKYSVDSIVGRSKTMQPVFEQILAARKNKANVLIVGESGTGKELIARAIHYNGPFGDRPFVAVNCAALPASLIESELFGHSKGAFTGATRESVGLFRTADGGTILLDEVLEMPLDTQAKLLRVLQDRRVRPVGGVAEVSIDVRVIAATNREPAEALEQGRLRPDLFYRLSVITICAPPLRKRPDDIPALIALFAARFARAYGLQIGSISQEAMELLNRYTWPGNIRELENLVEQWFALGRNDMITADDLPAEILAPQAQRSEELTSQQLTDVTPLREAERAMVRQALRAAEQNKSKAADLLGISRKKLYKLLNEEQNTAAGPSVPPETCGFDEDE